MSGIFAAMMKSLLVFSALSVNKNIIIGHTTVEIDSHHASTFIKVNVTEL